MTVAIIIGHIIEFLVVYIYLNSTLQRKNKNSITVLLGLLIYSAVLSLYFVFDSTAVNIIIGTIFNFLFTKLFFNCKIKFAIFYSLFLTVALTASEFLVMSITSISTNDLNAYKTSASEFLLLCLISRVVFLIITLTVGAIINKSNIKKTPPFLILFPIASTIMLYVLWYVTSNNNESETTSILISIAGISIILSVLLTYVFYAKTYKKLNELYVAQEEFNRAATDAAYYAIIDNQNSQLQTIIHNEKNHLSTIKSLAKNKEVSEYIDKIYGEIVENSILGNSKNKILDLIINKYQYFCSQENITFNVHVTTSNLSFIDAPDLTNMLGNILDNAVDAAKTSKQKKIELSINKVNGFDALTCINSCSKKPATTDGKLLSTKSDDGIHGIGIKSINKIVNKYSGTFEWAYNESTSEFSLYIVF